MSDTYLHAVARTPFGRYGGSLAGVRPDDPESGDADIVVAGGVECTTGAPWALPKPDRASSPAGDVPAVSSTLVRRLVNPELPRSGRSRRESATNCARRSSPSRERQDAVAVRSHRLAARAWDEDFYADLVLPVDGLARDEDIRSGTDPAKPAALRSACGRRTASRWPSCANGSVDLLDRAATGA